MILAAFIGSLSLACFVAAALSAAIATNSSVDDDENDFASNSAAVARLEQLEILDRIHLGLAAEKILSHFGFSKPPSNDKLWRKRSQLRDETLATQQRLASLNTVAAEQQHRRNKFDLHILGQTVTTDSGSSESYHSSDCGYGHPVMVIFPVHRAKGQILSAHLRFLPPSVELSSSVPNLEGEDGTLSLRVTVLNELQEAMRQTTLEDIRPSTLLNSSLAFRQLSDFRLSAHTVLQLAIFPYGVSNWCKIADFLALFPPALHLRVAVEPMSRQRRNDAASSQPLIGECETEWDRNMLTPAKSQLSDDLLPCCRRRVRVSFEELGWSDWVLAPREFDSFYCVGRCRSFGGFASRDVQGAAFYAELMSVQRQAALSGVSPCCSPVQFAPLTITVLSGPNEEMTQTLEDVVVQQCGCM